MPAFVKTAFVKSQKNFVGPERVVLYFSITLFSILVILVVKKLIKQKTRENSKIFENHLDNNS